jgi:hypothetical protein
MLALVGYQYLWEPLSAPARDYAQLFALLWLVVGVLSVVDPDWREKLAAIKDTVSVFKPTGSKTP